MSKVVEYLFPLVKMEEVVIFWYWKVVRVTVSGARVYVISCLSPMAFTRGFSQMSVPLVMDHHAVGYLISLVCTRL